ncbi:complex I intermediate-associated protein 30-domain-containing protein [Fimicolochytrium jonesii]|uniref:complex I intermediate-associated protein 30-domain-containing protein n=1 Tax=Fimicolochytrium jonesii TaxID=1396493 RepID=UPI0022FEEC33|nr:complex I intermediate-associated protein 30-domain-containing protein [Fimicolochytrium jonesii]KAI8824535.1 complex I intermediate-associated protein 30-domain-containing protein [Fimicolochytrium jonesii]
MSKGRMADGLRVMSSYFKRSFKYVADEAVAAIKFDTSWKKEMPLFQFSTVNDLQDWVVGSDADIGGLSEAYWGLTPQQTALFWGSISTQIPEGAKLERSGYAGIRSQQRPLTLFHHPRYDTTLFRYLAIRAKGDQRQWFVNLQTDSIYPTYLWQHRLYFQRPGEWETIMIPFRDFVLTSNGYVQKRQLTMDRSKIKTVGFSIVRQPGDYALELDWVKAVNSTRTFGDYDILDPGEYIDPEGNLRKVEGGQTLREALGAQIRIWPEKEGKGGDN